MQETAHSIIKVREQSMSDVINSGKRGVMGNVWRYKIIKTVRLLNIHIFRSPFPMFSS